MAHTCKIVSWVAGGRVCEQPGSFSPLCGLPRARASSPGLSQAEQVVPLSDGLSYLCLFEGGVPPRLCYLWYCSVSPARSCNNLSVASSGLLLYPGATGTRQQSYTSGSCRLVQMFSHFMFSVVFSWKGLTQDTAPQEGHVFRLPDGRILLSRV